MAARKDGKWCHSPPVAPNFETTAQKRKGHTTMNDMNTVNVIGRLTKDAELKYSSSGLAICNFSIAVNRSKKQGESYVDEASFFEATLLGKLAESMKQHLTKGKQVAITGFLKQDRWQNQDGENRSKVYIGVDSIQLVGGKSNSDGNSSNDNYGNSYGSSGYGSGNGYGGYGY